MALQIRTRPQEGSRTPSDSGAPTLAGGSRGFLLGLAAGVPAGVVAGLAASLWLNAAASVLVGFVVGSLAFFGVYLLVSGIPGVAKGLMVTMKHLMSPAVTQRYPEE